MSLNEFIQYQLLQIGAYKVTVGTVLSIVLILLLASLLLGLMRRGLMRIARRQEMDEGRRHAIEQLLRYLVWVSAFLLCLEAVGVKPTILLASSAALLVGLGLGLQQIFSDVVSGIFLLMEGTIRVGDILEVDGMVGRIEEINLRTSKFRNRDAISMIIPNRMFINEKVVNWSHNVEATRFQVTVGVAYNSDVEQVRRILLDCTLNNPDVIQNDLKQAPLVRLTGFGNSSIDFELLFYSTNMFRIENTKSDLRFTIRKAFLENNIEIPFPQQDIHFKNVLPTNSF